MTASRTSITERFPVLQQFRFPATVFVVSRLLRTAELLVSAGICRDPFAAADELGASAPKSAVTASRSVSIQLPHPSLIAVPESQVREEIRRCQAMIQERTGAAADTLAYPYGDSNARVRVIAAGVFYQRLTARELAFLTAGLIPWILPRIDAYYSAQSPVVRRLRGTRGRFMWLRAGRCGRRAA